MSAYWLHCFERIDCRVCIWLKWWLSVLFTVIEIKNLWYKNVAQHIASKKRLLPMLCSKLIHWVALAKISSSQRYRLPMASSNIANFALSPTYCCGAPREKLLLLAFLWFCAIWSKIVINFLSIRIVSHETHLCISKVFKIYLL